MITYATALDCEGYFQRGEKLASSPGKKFKEKEDTNSSAKIMPVYSFIEYLSRHCANE